MSRASEHLVEQAKAFYDFTLVMQRAVGDEPDEAEIQRVKQWIWESVNLGYSPVLLPKEPIEVVSPARYHDMEDR
jgi:hypothetical protein